MYIARGERRRRTGMTGVPLLFFLAVLAAIAVPAHGAAPVSSGQWGAGQACIGPYCPAPVSAGQWVLSQPVTATPSAGSFPAIVRVGYRKGNTTDYGSGTIVDRREKHAYVLTSWHTLRDQWPDGKAFVSTAKGGYWAKVERVDRQSDLAVLKIADPGIPPIGVAPADGRSGEAIRTGGYGSGRFELSAGRVQQINRERVLICSGQNRSGDSGGPVLNSRGQLIGVAWGSDGRICTAASVGPIRRILACVLPPYPRRPAVIVPKPVVVVPATPSPVVSPEIDYERLAALIYAKILAEPERFRGPGGPQGAQGPVGPCGPAGPTPAINYDALTQAIVDRLPPQRVEWETLDGTILSQEKPLGQPLRFRSIGIDARK